VKRALVISFLCTGFSAVRAQDVVPVGEKSLSDKSNRAFLAVKMLVVPMAVFKGNVLGASQSGYGFGALEALLGKEVSEAIGAIRLFLFGGESLSCQRLLAVGTSEAVAVIRLILVSHAAGRDHLLAFGALGRKELLVTSDAVIVFVLGNEALSPQSFLAVVASEAVLVPLLPLVFHLLGARFEDLTAAIASGGELVGVAISAVNLVFFAAKGLVDEAVAADAADETPLVPVLLFVREILGVCSDDFSAFFAIIGEKLFVASDAVGVFFPEDVGLAGQRFVAIPTAEMLGVEFLVHGARVFARED